MKVGVIGLGNMGLPMALTFSKHHDVYVYDIISKDKELEHTNIQFITDLHHLVHSIEVCFLCIKPNQILNMVQEITSNDKLKISKILFVSIAAGITIKQIEQVAIQSLPIIRVMPNTPFQISHGMSCFIANKFTSTQQKNAVIDLLKLGGEVLEIKNEDLFHAITAISGSGPAFVFLFMQTIENTGVSLGLNRDEAKLLAQQTVLGSALLSKKTNHCSFNELIEQVTSPGGTTIHGLLELKKQGFENSIYEAIMQAKQRSQDLSKGNM